MNTDDASPCDGVRLHAGPALSSSSIEPGSFRDRHGRVYHGTDAVYRGIDETALEEWNRLTSTKFFQRLSDAGTLIETERIPVEAATLPATDDSWAAMLKHRRVPFISYPYEWCFGMLRRVALLQLDLLLAALEEEMILKDATPFNFQWFGSRLTFIDIPSFERLSPGTPWIGYRQFCETMLYPLMLQAYKGVSFQPWLQGRIDGIEAGQFAGLISVRDLLRRGVLLHVYLQAKAQARYEDTRRDVRREIRGAGFSKAMIETNVKGLRRVVEGLHWGATRSTWSEYAEDTSYNDAEHRTKQEFVRAAVRDRPRHLVWDLGANTGEYSKIAAEHADYVVALDSDQLAVEKMFARLDAEGNENILPLVANLTSPSPNLGWRGLERKALTSRAHPDLTICLALIHHVVIGANVPLDEFVTWLGGLGSDLVIEFVDKRDPMVRRLLQNKDDIYEDYDRGRFEKCLAAGFEIVRERTIESGTRTLYYAHRR